MDDLACALLRAQLDASLVILPLLLLRSSARRFLGPEVAYRLWAAPPLAAFAALLPGPTAAHLAASTPWTLARGQAPALLVVWAAGVIVTGTLLWRGQAVFVRAMNAGHAGPAVVGVVCPRLVMPVDAGFYTASERALIVAHEREHIARRDPLAIALMAGLQALGWFNPLVHLATRLARLDQEMACDSSVLRERRGQKALYARTLLKTQLAAAPPPFGCHWGGGQNRFGRHPLETRVAMLRAGPHAPGDHPLGPSLVTAAVLAAAAAAWLCQPPVPRQVGVTWPAAAPAPLILVDLSPGAGR